MAFLDNSGDIILDAVLTDTGRLRLAQGDGTFRIQRFAFGDDEIDYQLYDIDNSGGEAYYPLTILETPIMEAFSNNAGSMKSRCISLTRNNILYLPILKLFDNGDSARFGTGPAAKYVVAVDKPTVDAMVTDRVLSDGILNGFQTGQSSHLIRIDQGIDNALGSPQSIPLASDLIETQYLVQIDNRLGMLMTPVGQKPRAATPSFIDDDQIATYALGAATDPGYIMELATVIDGTEGGTFIAGSVGTRVSFRIQASVTLRTSSTLFSRLGFTTKMAYGSLAAGDAKQIDSIISITGQNLGYRMDLPVSFVKKN